MTDLLWPKSKLLRKKPMCHDLAEYDPFEPLYIYSGNTYAEDIELLDEPMEEYNWQEFLEADDYLLDLNF